MDINMCNIKIDLSSLPSACVSCPRQQPKSSSAGQEDKQTILKAPAGRFKFGRMPLAWTMYTGC